MLENMDLNCKGSIMYRIIANDMVVASTRDYDVAVSLVSLLAKSLECDTYMAKDV